MSEYHRGAPADCTLPDPLSRHYQSSLAVPQSIPGQKTSQHHPLASISMQVAQSPQYLLAPCLSLTSRAYVPARTTIVIVPPASSKLSHHDVGHV